MIAIPNIEKSKSCTECPFEVIDTSGYPRCVIMQETVVDGDLFNRCSLIDTLMCKDCNRSATDDGGNTFCMWLGALRQPTDFCSYGERKGTGVKGAITQLEIIATNMVGRLAETHDEREAKIINKQIEALDMGIDALKKIGG